MPAPSRRETARRSSSRCLSAPSAVTATFRSRSLAFRLLRTRFTLAPPLLERDAGDNRLDKRLYTIVLGGRFGDQLFYDQAVERLDAAAQRIRQHTLGEASRELGHAAPQERFQLGGCGKRPAAGKSS